MARPKNEVPMLPNWDPLWLRTAVPAVTSYADLKRLLRPDVPVKENRDGKHLANWINILGLDISHFTGHIVQPKEISEVFRKAAINRAEFNAGETDVKFCIKCKEYKAPICFYFTYSSVCRRCVDMQKVARNKIVVTEKKCNTPGCGIKPISEFYPRSRSKDSHTGKCKACWNKIKKERFDASEELRIKRSIWSKRRYDEILADPARKEQMQKARKQYRAANIDRLRLRDVHYKEKVRQDVEKYEFLKAQLRQRSKENVANLTDKYVSDKLKALIKCNTLDLEGEDGKNLIEAYRNILSIKRLNRKQRRSNEQGNELT